LSGAAYIGFDMDYTLAIYDQSEMDELSIRATARRKLTLAGLPVLYRRDSLRYELSHPRRAHRQALRSYPQDGSLQRWFQRGYHGMRQLSRDEIGALYQSKKITAHHRSLSLDRYALRAERGPLSTRGIVDFFRKKG